MRLDFEVSLLKLMIMFSTLNFRRIAIAEGWSYIILLLITWPLKALEIASIPNKIVGMAHGILFISYVLFSLLFWNKEAWSIKKLAIVLAASLLPLATFYIEKNYLRD